MKKALCFLLVLCFMLVLPGCIRTEQRREPEQKWIQVSWSKSYATIRELTLDSDLIVIASVTGSKAASASEIPATLFTMKIDTLLWGEPLSDTFEIYMTGGTDAAGDLIQVSGDPLMEAGQMYLVFCQENRDGSFTVLGGPQGRFRYQDGGLTAVYQPDNSLIMPRGSDADTISAQIIGCLTTTPDI